MTTTGICPLDGYPTTTTVAGDGATMIACANPWHPVRPTPCPHCASPRLPGEAMVVDGPRPDARCRACGRSWLPKHMRA